ncbi:MAG: hypothetical protein LBL44_08275, partial [Treponema sp.]|nr:hypothetical protein [Treponema sp.]
MKIIYIAVFCCVALAACGTRAGAPPSSGAALEEASITAAADAPGVTEETETAAMPMEDAGPPPGPEFPFRFTLKPAPPGMTVSFDGQALRGKDAGNGTAAYAVEKKPEGAGAGVLSFTSEGYREISMEAAGLDGFLKNGQLEIKLEKENGVFEKITELQTGVQPKSAYFS